MGFIPKSQSSAFFLFPSLSLSASLIVYLEVLQPKWHVILYSKIPVIWHEWGMGGCRLPEA